jgi:hypothetical protein
MFSHRSRLFRLVAAGLVTAAAAGVGAQAASAAAPVHDTPNANWGVTQQVFNKTSYDLVLKQVIKKTGGTNVVTAPIPRIPFEFYDLNQRFTNSTKNEGPEIKVIYDVKDVKTDKVLGQVTAESGIACVKTSFLGCLDEHRYEQASVDGAPVRASWSDNHGDLWKFTTYITFTNA